MPTIPQKVLINLHKYVRAFLVSSLERSWRVNLLYARYAADLLIPRLTISATVSLRYIVFQFLILIPTVISS